MQFQLADKEKVGWIMIGKNIFTFDDPGPKEIDLKTTPLSERNQLLYNCRRGILACGDPDLLLKSCQDVWSASKGFATPNEVPAKPQKRLEIDEVLEKDNQTLKDILTGSVATIKRKAADLPPAKIRKLVEFEIVGKNRKGVKTLCNEILTTHANEVMEAVFGEDVGDTITPTGVGQTTSPIVSDIVESDLEQLVLNPLGDDNEDEPTT